MVSTLVEEPVYHQLTNHLRQSIQSDACPVGTRLLTERQICERFGVSRATANKALSSLVSTGPLEFRKGVGTFVRLVTQDYNPRALVNFTEEAQAAGKRPGTQVLRIERVRSQDVLDEIPEGASERVQAVNLRGGRGAPAESPERRGWAAGEFRRLHHQAQAPVVRAHALPRRCLRVSQSARRPPAGQTGEGRVSALPGERFQRHRVLIRCSMHDHASSGGTWIGRFI
jgi:DNA-binding transcriptional regulator YhcF (GntR family)